MKDAPKRTHVQSESGAANKSQDMISPPLKKLAVMEVVQDTKAPLKPAKQMPLSKPTKGLNNLDSKHASMAKVDIGNSLNKAGTFKRGQTASKFTGEMCVVGNRVKVKVLGKWTKGTIVKPVRANVSENFKIKGVKIHLDGTPFQGKQFPVPSKDIVCLDEAPKIVDMNNNSFKILDNAEDDEIPEHHLTSEFKVLGHDDYFGSKETKANLVRADNAAKKILQEIGETSIPTKDHVFGVLRQIGEEWPTQVYGVLVVLLLLSFVTPALLVSSKCY
jgi:hypothetical protein